MSYAEMCTSLILGWTMLFFMAIKNAKAACSETARMNVHSFAKHAYRNLKAVQQNCASMAPKLLYPDQSFQTFDALYAMILAS